MRYKKGIEFSFNWLFAIIVGGIIILLAVYGAVKIVGTERTRTETVLGKELGIVTTPLETSAEEARASAPIKLTDETRIYNGCYLTGAFGEQGIKTAVKSGLGASAWGTPSIESRFANKYIFSETVLQGKEFFVFSESFNVPFKAGDILYLWTNKYCFVNPTNEIRSDIEDLNLKNINISERVENCDKGSRKVCFTASSASGCDIVVNYAEKSVTRGKDKVYYEDIYDNSLIYGAIFANASLYECQLKRLLKRAAALANLNIEKNKILLCSNTIESELARFANLSISLRSSAEIGAIFNEAKIIEGINNELNCKLF